MEPPDSPSPTPDWLTLPENVTVAIFDLLNPGMLLSLRQVCTQWQRLSEASAQTRDKLVLIQCGCEDNENCYCSFDLIVKSGPGPFFSHLNFNADGTKYDKIEDNYIILQLKVNGIRCRSFDWKKAQLVARLFPQISHFTVSHNFISAGHLDQILYLLAQWSRTLTAFQFHSDYTLENPNKRLTRSLTVASAKPPTEAYLNSQLTRLFAQLKSLSELKHLTLNYLKGKINSTVGDFAFLPRLEELNLDRTSLEANLQASCQRYLAPPVPDAHPVLRRFTHNVNQVDATEREFIRFLQYSPEALPLATASTWNPLVVQHLTDLPNFLLRFNSLSCLDIPIPPENTLGPLSRSLSSHNVTVLVLDILGTNAGEEDAVQDIVPVPSVRGLTIALYSPDHGRICQLLAQMPTVFPRLSSLFLLDFRSQCSNAPSGAPFSTTADEPREFVRYARDLLAAYPLETQPTKYQQVQSFLTIARQINTSFSSLNRSFAFKDEHPNLVLRLTSQQ